jgi:hypothetical protein
MEETVVKYYYGAINAIINLENLTDMGLNILSDALARVLDVPDETKCVALNLNISKSKRTNRLILNGIKFSPKKVQIKNWKENKRIKLNNEDQINEFRQRIIDLIEYCFGNDIFGNGNFTFKSKKLKILKQIAQLLNTTEIEYLQEIDNKMFGEPFTLEEFMTYLTERIDIDNEDTSKKSMLNNLLITFFDIQFLREIFPRHFEISTNFEENIEILLPAQNIHAELQLVTQLTNKKYIGISLTCCPQCSYVLDKRKLYFRGQNSKQDRGWKNHSEMKIDVKRIEFSANGLPILEERRISDGCQLANKCRSNDMCHYLRYYQEILRKSQDTLNCLNIIKDITEELSNHHCEMNLLND